MRLITKLSENAITENRISKKEQAKYLEAYSDGLKGYTYFEK